MARALGLLCIMLFAGCEGIVADRDLGADPNAQVEFDLTSDGDRGQFAATDLEYKGAVGSYALFLVTGPAPRLDGPQVRFGGGYAVLRGASTYFAPSAHAPEVSVSLAGGASAEAQLLSLLLPLHASGCATAQDQWAQRPSVQATVERIGVAVAPEPPVGSLMLLRRVAISGQAPGPGTSPEADVCCTDGTCVLQ
jgi:hypothetical protein